VCSLTHRVHGRPLSVSFGSRYLGISEKADMAKMNSGGTAPDIANARAKRRALAFVTGRAGCEWRQGKRNVAHATQ